MPPQKKASLIWINLTLLLVFMSTIAFHLLFMGATTILKKPNWHTLDSEPFTKCPDCSICLGLFTAVIPRLTIRHWRQWHPACHIWSNAMPFQSPSFSSWFHLFHLHPQRMLPLQNHRKRLQHSRLLGIPPYQHSMLQTGSDMWAHPPTSLH